MGNINVAQAFSSTQSGFKSMIDPTPTTVTDGTAFFIDELGNYIPRSQFELMPKTDFTDLGLLKSTTNNKVLLYPVHAQELTSNFLLFELDEIYWCPNINVQAEDTLLDQLANNYIIFQNIFRTQYHDFFCINKDI